MTFLRRLLHSVLAVGLVVQFLSLSASDSASADELPSLTSSTFSQVDVGGISQRIDISWAVSAGTASGDLVRISKKEVGSNEWETIAEVEASLQAYSISAKLFSSNVFYDVGLQVRRGEEVSARTIASKETNPSSGFLGFAGDNCLEFIDKTLGCLEPTTGAIKYSNPGQDINAKRYGDCLVTGTQKVVCKTSMDWPGLGFGTPNNSLWWDEDSHYSYVLSGFLEPLQGAKAVSGSCALTANSNVWCWGRTGQILSARLQSWETSNNVAIKVSWPESATKIAANDDTICGFGGQSGILTCRTYSATSTVVSEKAGVDERCILSVTQARLCLGLSAPFGDAIFRHLGISQQQTAWDSIVADNFCVLSLINGKFACRRDSNQNSPWVTSTEGDFSSVSQRGTLAMKNNSDVYFSLQVGGALAFVPFYSWGRVLVNFEPNQTNCRFPVNQVSQSEPQMKTGSRVTGSLQANSLLLVNPYETAGFDLVDKFYVGSEVADVVDGAIALSSETQGKPFVWVETYRKLGCQSSYFAQGATIGGVSPNSLSLTGTGTLGSTIQANVTLAPGTSLSEVSWSRSGGTKRLGLGNTFVPPIDSANQVIWATATYIGPFGALTHLRTGFTNGNWSMPVVEKAGELLNRSVLSATISGTELQYTARWLYFDRLQKKVTVLPGANGLDLQLMACCSENPPEDIVLELSFEVPGANNAVLDIEWPGVLHFPTFQTDTPSLTGPEGQKLVTGRKVYCSHLIVEGVTYQYTWFEDGFIVPDAHSQFLPTVSEDAGKQVWCNVRGLKDTYETYSKSSDKVLLTQAPEPTTVIWGSGYSKRYAPNAVAKLSASIVDFGAGHPDNFAYSTKAGQGSWSKPKEVQGSSLLLTTKMSGNFSVRITFEDETGIRTFVRTALVAPTISASCSKVVKVVGGRVSLVCGLYKPKVVRGFKQGGVLVITAKVTSWYKGTCGAVASTSKAYTGSGLYVGRDTGISLGKFKIVNGVVRIEVPVKFNGVYTWVVSCSMPGYATVYYDDVFKQTSQ